MTPEEELKQLTGADNITETTPPPAPENTTAAPANPTPGPTLAPNFWDDAEIEPKKPETAPATNATEGTKTAITPAMYKASARTAVATLNLTQVTLFRPLLNWRFNKTLQKKFKPEDLERAWELEIENATPVNDHEKGLKSRIKKYLYQRDQKLSAIPFTTEEETDLELAFTEYFKAKQITMSPEVLLYCALASSIGKRGIDVFIWD